ncbi:uncharacterized protein LOC112468641 isoform X3 [Temnothorax curvispinosus]|uniref:Uncharacterized protein LOC112468641 isoform X3 n=1 Tax=Temnothorax curvispinosus TaxID=300111 RepID=A0A6J1RG08_9HYME|nr:uncharacterized protein LOC112468641 isoform X3 [Temnothorax curvispinosus]
MYVFYPADELLRIYENPIRRSVPLTVNDDAAVNVVYEDINQQRYQQQSQQSQSHQQQRIVVTNDVRKRKEKKRETSQTAASRRQQQIVRNGNGGDAGKKEGRRNEEQQARTMQNNRATGSEEAANHPLKDLTQPSLNEPLKQHNGVALKLVQTVSEFAQELGAAMESHSANVRRLVDEFRSRSGDSRVDVGGMRRVWESLLRQVEADAASHLDLAAVLQQQLSRPTLEASFHRKLQSRKVFAHRDAYEQVVSKTEEKLQRTRLDYKRAYAALLTNEAGGGAEQELKRAYFESHNAYILQLRATNAITERYQSHCLPGLLGEIAEVYEELCGLACKCVAGTSDAAGERSGEQAKRYQAVAKEAQAIVPSNDLQTLARNLSVNATPRKPPRRLYVAPAPPEQIPMERISQMPTLRDELVPTGTSTLPLMEDLKRDYDGLNLEIGRLQDALDALVRMQRKSAESNLYTKVAELQEDISLKRLDLGVAQLRLAAVQAQKELFGGGEAGQPDGVASRKMSNGSTGSPKLKWLKAFKSLKTSSPTTPPLSDKYCFANARLIKRKAGNHVPRSFHRRHHVQEEPRVRGRAHLARVHVSQDHAVRRVRAGAARPQPPGRPLSRLQGERAHGLHQHGAAGVVPEFGAEEGRRYTASTTAKDASARRRGAGVVRAQRGRHIPGAEAGRRDPWKLDKLTTYASHSRTSPLRCSTFVSEGLLPSLFLVHLW